MAYTTDDIVTDAKLRAFYPTSGGVLSDSDIIRLATDELLSIITAEEMAAVQGHLAVETSIALVGNQQRYDVPYRAAGSKIRYACLQNANGDRSNIRFGRPERFVTTYNVTQSQQGTMPQYSWFEDGRIVLYPVPTDATYSLIVGMYLRPGRLVLAASSTTATTASAGATSFTIAAAPSYLNGTTSIDIISAKPPFQVRAYDLAVSSISTSATTVNVTASGGLPFALSTGDYVTKTEESVVPQMPAEMHPLLAARTAKRILQARGDLVNLNAVKEDIQEMESQIYEYLSNRNEGQIDTLADNVLMRPGRTRFGFGLGGF